jgi:peroxiredoxin
VEYPHLVDLYKRYGGSDFVILGVEGTNRPKLAKAFLEEMGVTFPVVMDDKKVAKELYKIKGYPTTYLIDTQGRIIFRHLGFSEGKEKTFEAEIQLLLEGDLAQKGSGS